MTNEERDKLINSILPDTVKGQQRPAENINPDMPYSTDFPQLTNKDPASADVFNLINRQLLSNDKSLNDSKADKTYVDKKVADLVNGAPEQLDTLQELSKALNNDKDYAVTVNNALAEKLGKTEKAVSAETADSAKVADSANTLEGVPLSHGGDSTFGKIPIIGDDGVLEIGKYIDFHSKNGDGKDYSTRIEANDNGTISVSGGINANLKGNVSGKATASKGLYGIDDFPIVLAAAKSRMGDSTRAADIVVFVPSPQGDYSKNNDKEGGINNAYHALRIAPWLQEGNNYNQDTINGVLSDKTSNLRICPSFKPVSSNGTVKTLGEVSLTACYYENVGADSWQESMYMTEGKSVGIQLNADTQKLWLSLKSRRNSTTEEETNLYDLGASAIVSQQLGLNGYTKYADGRLKMWGCVYVDRNDASVSSTENPGFKFHENYKTVTFPVTVKEIHNVVAVPNALHGVYYESCCIRVKNNSSLNVILIGLQRLADDIMGVDNKVWYLLHGTWK